MNRQNRSTRAYIGPCGFRDNLQSRLRFQRRRPRFRSALRIGRPQRIRARILHLRSRHSLAFSRRANLGCLHSRIKTCPVIHFPAERGQQVFALLSCKLFHWRDTYDLSLSTRNYKTHVGGPLYGIRQLGPFFWDA